MFRVPLATSSTVIPVDNFYKAVYLYHEMPHVVNRKIAAITPVSVCQLSFDYTKLSKAADVFRREALLYETRKIDFSSITLEFVKNIVETHDKDVKVTEVTWDDVKDSSHGIFVSVRILLGRNNMRCLELVIFDKAANTTSFLAVQESDKTIAPNFPYHIELTADGNFRIFLDSFEDADTSSADWLADNLFGKLMKWTEDWAEHANTVHSLSLVPADEYYMLYSELKTKYGTDLVKAWPDKTKTNPQKYVHEDLAIAAYLMSFWRKIKATNVYFVDCGCGNGLLVYVLNQEGFKGHGIDIRSRKTWEIYDGKADLRVDTITPDSRFKGATWLIGNHSDELTPWIPVIAAVNEGDTNYFVLPCCAYDLNGRKYVRTNTKVSQYCDYLNYVKDISEKCDFVTEMDKLRIPSTKRTCLIGTKKESGWSKNALQFYFKAVNKMNIGNQKYVTRNPVESVRNCTRINRFLIKRLVDLIVRNLLTSPNFIRKTHCEELWNKGGEIHISEFGKLIPRDDLLEIKNECGGLQTLVKNHRYIFKYEGGFVCLRDPPVLSEDTQKYRDKPCWFIRNHPQGCLNSDETCASKHF